MAVIRPKPEPLNAKDKKVRAAFDEVLAPIQVNEALAKLCKRHDPRLVMAAVEAWLTFMQSVTDTDPHADPQTGRSES